MVARDSSGRSLLIQRWWRRIRKLPTMLLQFQSDNCGIEPDKELPTELLINILIRVPVKTLIGFTSVCKSWYSLINDPYFITTHLNHSIFCRNSNIITLAATDDNYFYSVLCNKNFDELLKQKLPFRSTKRNDFEIVGSCNGLVCVASRSRNQSIPDLTIVLWNPATKKFRTLPPYVYNRAKWFYEELHFFVGFGCYPLSNDFKVVQVLYYDVNLVWGCHGLRSIEAKVYSPSTGTWREVKADGLPPIVSDDTGSVFVNGAIHWMGAARDVVLSFDLSSEEFEKIVLPEEVCSVGVFMDSLAVFVYRTIGSESWDMWVMKDTGFAKSWATHVSIARQELVSRTLHSVPIFTTKDNEVVLLSAERRLVLFYPETLEFKEIGNYGHGFNCRGMVNFMESLVPV